MIYIFSFLGYGDSLITGSIIENMRHTATSACLVGTEFTAETWEIMRIPLKPDVVLLSKTASFFKIKSSSLADIIHDFKIVRSWASFNIREWDTVIFETPSEFRNHLLLFGTKCNAVTIKRRTSAYFDRSHAFSRYFGFHQWHDSVSLSKNPNRILINPCAGDARRHMGDATLGVVLKVLNKIGVQTYLLDHKAAYGDFRSEVDVYIVKPTLVEAVSILRLSDFYIGPDSFFTHLAYYFNIPQLALFWKKDTYFEPPGLSRVGGLYYFDDLSESKLFEKKVFSLLS